MLGDFAYSYKRQNLIKKIFYIYTFVLLFFIAILLLGDKLKIGKTTLFANTLIGERTITDFTVVLRFCLIGERAYSKPDYCIYLPLTLLFMYPFALICKKDLSSFLNFQNADTTIDVIWLDGGVNKELLTRPLIWVSYSLYLIICLVAIFFLIKKIFKFNITETIYCFCILVFSAPFLFVALRGNILLVSFVFLLCFFAFYNSNNKILKEFALISLAISSIFKLYPIVFAGVLVYKKNWLAIVRFLLYFIALTILPALLFKGCLPALLNNFTAFFSDTRLLKVANFSLTGWVYKLLNLFMDREKYGNIMYNIGQLVTLLFLLVSAICIICTKSEYNRLLLCGCLILIVPTISYYYGAMFLFLLLPYSVCNFENDKHHAKIKIYTVLFSSIMSILFKPITLIVVLGFSIFTIVKIIKDKEIIIWFKNIFKKTQIED